MNSPNLQAQPTKDGLTMDAAVDRAIAADPWLEGSHYRQGGLMDAAIAAMALPDPSMSLTASNLPTDTFNTHQEAMTQLTVGISQMFPRGDSLSLAGQKKTEMAAREPWLRLDRKAKTSMTVRQIWLAVYQARQSSQLIEQSRVLFEQLADAASIGYSVALGHSRQQDLIRARLELTRLEDRLTVFHQQRDAAQRRLSEWLPEYTNQALDTQLPNQHTAIPINTLYNNQDNKQTYYTWINQHPTLAALDQHIAARSTDVALAHQRYKPAWGINARYSYRNSNTSGQSRADLLSLGVSFDLPLFTANLQDKELSAARSRLGASRTDRQLLLRRLMAELENAVAQLHRLDERQQLYEQQLLPQMAEQAEAALTAYNNDVGDFAESVRARIAELDARIVALNIAVERQQLIARINYALAGVTPTRLLHP